MVRRGNQDAASLGALEPRQQLGQAGAHDPGRWHVPVHVHVGQGQTLGYGMSYEEVVEAVFFCFIVVFQPDVTEHVADIDPLHPVEVATSRTEESA
ncbi:hypothetical protein [Frankia gtarii]|uniref:hypothetical protein n=1 Tax=Frankia gtarii TaxID=2950102 RepID=UPI0021C0059F|nr:hypothetical protein [Frankia gtarii]